MAARKGPRPINLKGAAATAFMHLMQGRELTEEEKMASLAIRIHLSVEADEMPRAIATLRELREQWQIEGSNRALDALMERQAPPEPSPDTFNDPEDRAVIDGA